MKSLIAVIATCAGLCAALPASAQFAKPEDAVNYRESVMTITATHFGRIGQMVQGRVPFDAKMAAENAELVATMSKLPWAAFGPGYDKQKSQALPAVWSESDKFKTAYTDFQDKAAKLDTAAKSGDLAVIKTAFGEVGQSCKACHDNFRSK